MLIPGAFLLDGIPEKTSCRKSDEGSILYMPTTLPGLPNREAGWIVQQMDKKLKALPGSRARLRKDWPRRHVNRSGTADDDRDDGAAEAEVAVAATGMTKDKLVAEMDKAAADDRLRERVGAADSRARDDAEPRASRRRSASR